MTSRSMLSLAASLLLFALLSSSAAAKTDLEKFQSKVGESAVTRSSYLRVTRIGIVPVPLSRSASALPTTAPTAAPLRAAFIA